MFSACRRWFPFGLMLMVSVLSPLASAELLEIRVPSEQRSEEAETKAVEQAFMQAVVQLSGDESAADDKALIESLGEPQSYLNSYYDEPAAEGAPGWVYVVAFEKELLTAKLRVGDTGEPAPEVAMMSEPSSGPLLWMVVEQQMGDVFLLTRDTHLSLASDLRDWLSGGNWALPPQSAVGSTGVSIGSVLNTDTRTIQRISQVLGFETSVSVVLTELGPSSWLARVSHMGSGREDALGDASTYAEALQIALGGENQEITEAAPVPASETVTAGEDSSTVTIAVSGINGYADYSRVTNYLNELTSVENWSPRGSSAGVALFEVKMSGNHELFLSDMTEVEGAPLTVNDKASHDAQSAHYRFALK